ncbi:unnamed protein product, partial [Strongylus vulgaris]
MIAYYRISQELSVQLEPKRKEVTMRTCAVNLQV